VLAETVKATGGDDTLPGIPSGDVIIAHDGKITVYAGAVTRRVLEREPRPSPYPPGTIKLTVNG
jgi:hypothetical protein